MIRVLIVDDESLARERLKRLLAEVEGYVCCGEAANGAEAVAKSLRLEDRKSTRLNSSHVRISYAVFCLKKKNHTNGLHWTGIDWSERSRTKHADQYQHL